MSPVLPALLALMAVAAAAFAALATPVLGASARLPSWTAAALGVAGLIFALFSGTTRPLDLATVVGVVLIGGIRGSGWAPSGRKMLLLVALAGLAIGTLARFFAFSDAVANGPDAELATINLSWNIARSAGFVAFLAATGAIVLGARRPSRLPIKGLPARVYALHRALGLAALLAITIHLVALRLDDFIRFTWVELLAAPWTASYYPFALMLGWLAAVSLILTAASGSLRRFLPGWRAVHALAYLTFALGLSYGLLAGSDSGSPATLVFYFAALLTVGWSLYRRLFGPTPHSRRSRKKAIDGVPSTIQDTTAIGWDEVGGSPAPCESVDQRAHYR